MRVAMARERLDARIGEIAFTVPAYGDLLVLGNNALSYRKRLAPVATVCAFDDTTLTIRLQRTELNLLRVGDSVAVLRTSSTPANPRFATAALTTVTPGASCQPLTPGAVTLAAPLAAPLPASEVARGATTRVWSVRSYAVEADPAAPGRYQLIERVNGADPAKLFGPFANPSVFTYWQDEAGTIPATDALNTTLLRASFTPIVALASRARAAAGAEVMEFPVGGPPRNEVLGEVPPPTGPVTPCRAATPPARPTTATPSMNAPSPLARRSSRPRRIRRPMRTWSSSPCELVRQRERDDHGLRMDGERRRLWRRPGQLLREVLPGGEHDRAPRAG